ncbi:RAMP superfamily CRISPR-associated protein [Paenibacillus sp. RC334]|uniref:RAMP superfamily CRISPR-associated protein n=1 Tax=Paenibacillus sp. RC334 TaxID=3045840 RepID=UPI0024BB1F57|nr:RAMP superfamily CRISPR-associated protein [Paenibacillus sp. RC334]
MFYSAANGNQAQYLSPSMISQQVYYTKIKEMLTKNGGYEPCEDRHCVCPACALFGMIPPDEQNTRSRTARQALGSRVRFTDATLLESSLLKERKDYYRGDIRLPAMGEPKPGAVEFYTKKPSDYQEGALFWTYDYWVKKEGKTRTPIKDSAFGIRGRKFYWHSENWKQYKDKLHGISTEFLKENINTNMTAGVRPLNHEKCPAFQFKVYYEHLTWDELNQLKWSLDFNDSACSHKIGRGKPLGFGSIQLKIEQVMQRTIDLQTGEWFMKQFPDTCREELPESDAMKDLKLITGWESKPTATISYPQIRLERTTEPREQQNNVNEEASHRWFTENAKRDKKVLPTIQEEMSANEASNWLKKIKVK